MNLFKASLASLAVLVATLPAAEKTLSLNGLQWLSGSWKLEANGKLIEEHWTRPSGGTMIGMSRTTANGETVSFEFLRIEQRGEGLVYIAQPQGAPPTEFPLVQSTAGDVVFANPQHDFPQRIRYRRNQDGSVSARIEDESGKKGMDFNYVRFR